MTVLWIVGGIGAVGGSVVVLAVERERVARRNLVGAKAVVRVNRRIWWAALRAAALAVFVALVVLGVLYLASTGGR